MGWGRRWEGGGGAEEARGGRGVQADLDLGNYERFLNVTLTRDHNITTGKVYKQVIEAERRGDYLGKTVQVIPHVTTAVQEWIEKVARLPVDGSRLAPEVCLVEVGGTVGDIESLVFLEALRQLRTRQGGENVVFVHVSLVPVIGAVGEQKTKPTQHSVKELRSVGIAPDVIICRSTESLHPSTQEKLALFCQVPARNVLAVHDVSNIYHVPLILHRQGVHSILVDRLGLRPPRREAELDAWRDLALTVDSVTEELRIALVGKYNGLSDAYLSVLKALKHSSVVARRLLVVDWINAQSLEPATRETDRDAYDASWATLRAAHGILVPGGFGDRGVEGKILAVKEARESKRPFLGICLGMQCAVIEQARHVCGLAGAHSTEMDEGAPHPVVVFMPEINPTQMGGTMRLGARRTNFTNFGQVRGSATADAPAEAPGGGAGAAAGGGGAAAAAGEGEAREADSATPKDATLVRKVYNLSEGQDSIIERHRHRYEVNPEYVNRLQRDGFFFTGVDDAGVRMEVIERRDHPFFLAVQYHPEFKSNQHNPSPPYLQFVRAAAGLFKHE
jgi:CTP synthase